MSIALPPAVDVIASAPQCGVLCGACRGRKRRLGPELERAPEDEAGVQQRFTAGAFRCVYDGVEDLRALNARSDRRGSLEIRFRHLYRGEILRRHGAVSPNTAPTPISVKS